MKLNQSKIRKFRKDMTEWAKNRVMLRAWQKIVEQDQKRAAKSLRESREAEGISLRGAAKALGITPAYMSDIERGRRNIPLRWLLPFENGLPSAGKPKSPWQIYQNAPRKTWSHKVSGRTLNQPKSNNQK